MSTSLDVIVSEMIERALEKELKGWRLSTADLQKRVEELEANLVTFEREVYDVKDLAELLNCSTDHVRKEFIKTEKIKACKPKGSKSYCIDKEEFKRVTEIVHKYGKHSL
jgi:excisionase family DNA binding protein